jgi:type I restriction-modification system DNA methylase subunit
LFEQRDLLTDNADPQFDRFLFTKLFHRDMLIATSGRPALWRLVERQWVREGKIEEEFYGHYKAVRERLFNVLSLNNRDFSGTPTDLLRVSQKLLDRFIFAFYCEDMGERMLFPPQFLRDLFVSRSKEAYYEANDTDIWNKLKRLFGCMDSGEPFGGTPVPHINGGLFAEDAQINSLVIPNHMFACVGQGANDASLEKDTKTLLYLSARYNYAAKGDAKESLSLYTLGRIFEQSITELEYRVGELEGRETVAKLSKRKRDGVYYTPERVVNYLVEETLGPWFAAAKAECGYADEFNIEASKAYLEKLSAIRIIDPACGSGAFLISAFRRLLDERKSVAREIDNDRSVVDETPLIADILQNNIFGVDINPSSVEIAKLALWLHSARAKAPLSALDHTIRCGNSLVGPDCWTMMAKTPENEARINPFDWANERYDVVLGNPPYVKLQNLMKVDSDVVAYLQAQRANGTYESAKTGNFDLYLPFIELGLRLLNEKGRMAYIAPSLWAVNEYGAALRKLLHRTRQLERWIDFKSYQVFEEAITYTALQFFTHAPNESVKVVISPEGEMGDIDWTDDALAVPSASLRDDREWLMVTGEDREIIARLARDCLRLDDRSVTSGITVGIQTSADSIYHLRKIGNNSYECSPPKRTSYVVEIEDAIMKPLISGQEAQRYEASETEIHLLFPYERNSLGNMSLIEPLKFKQQFPHAWSYLNSYENELRKRENSKMDTEHWYAYNYPKNLDKQDKPKLLVPRLVKDMSCNFDSNGKLYLDNVDVGGVIATSDTDPNFLLAALNGPVANFVFRRISKPFQNGYWSANKQFIAPLPIPHADAKTQKIVGAMARDLQERWTNRRDLLKDAAARLSTLGRAKHGAKWLWPDLPDLAEIEDGLPKRLLKSECAEQAKKALEDLHERSTEVLQGILNSGVPLSASFNNGELKLSAGGTVVLHKIYLDDADGALTLAYWNYLVLMKHQRDAKSLAAHLRCPPIGPASAAARQFMERAAALQVETETIRDREQIMNETLYDLYRLTENERTLIKKDCAKRPLL